MTPIQQCFSISSFRTHKDHHHQRITENKNTTLSIILHRHSVARGIFCKKERITHSHMLHTGFDEFLLMVVAVPVLGVISKFSLRSLTVSISVTTVLVTTTFKLSLVSATKSSLTSTHSSHSESYFWKYTFTPPWVSSTFKNIFSTTFLKQTEVIYAGRNLDNFVPFSITQQNYSITHLQLHS